MRPRFNSLIGKIRWRRDRLPTPVFLVFPCSSAGKESACNAGDLGSIPGLGRESLSTPVFWPGEFHGLYNLWGVKESDMTEQLSLGFPSSSDSKASVCSAGDPGSIPGLGRSPGEGNGNPPQYFCLEDPMDGGTW